MKNSYKITFVVRLSVYLSRAIISGTLGDIEFRLTKPNCEKTQS